MRRKGGARMGTGEKNASSTSIICNTINNVFNKLIGFFALWAFLHYLHLYFIDVGGEPDKICKFAEAIGLKNIALGVAGLLGGSALYLERRGKKRAIKTLGDCRRDLEKNDPVRTSSGLTDTGETPEEEE